MRRLTSATILLISFTAGGIAAKKLTIQDLPPDVQKTVQAELKGGEIKSIDRETENGVTQYEVETIRNGKHRDFEVDLKGKLLVVEEETTIESLPAPAKAAILKKVADGKLGMVEQVLKGGETMFEAAYTTKTGRKHEVVVKSDGTETKD